MTGRRAALATLAAAALLLGTAGPASAAEGLNVTVGSPGDGEVLDGANAVIAGTASTDSLHTVNSVSVRLTSLKNPNAPFECVRSCGAGGGTSTSFSYGHRLDYNGPYRATVTATDLLLVVGGERATTVTRNFKVEVPPARPDPKVEVGADRRVTISWARNTEPDLKGYQVQRLAPGSSTWTTVANVAPSSGARVTVVDDKVPAAGGNYRYLVLAVRPDGDGEVTQRATPRTRECGAEVVATPADPNAPPGSGGAGPGAGPGTAPASTVGGGPKGALDVSGFLSRTGGAPPSLAVPGGVALPVDNGFSDLPFAVPGGEVDDQSDSTDPAVLGTTESAANERALFVPIAAGLLLCVLAFHLRQFNRTVLAAPAAYHPIVEPDRDPGDDADFRPENDAEDDGGDPRAGTAVLVGARRPPREG